MHFVNFFVNYFIYLFKITANDTVNDQYWPLACNTHTQYNVHYYEREREFISQINGGLPDKAFAHRAGHSKHSKTNSNNNIKMCVRA